MLRHTLEADLCRQLKAHALPKVKNVSVTLYQNRQCQELDQALSKGIFGQLFRRTKTIRLMGVYSVQDRDRVGLVLKHRNVLTQLSGVMIQLLAVWQKQQAFQLQAVKYSLVFITQIRTGKSTLFPPLEGQSFEGVNTGSHIDTWFAIRSN